MRAGRPSGLCSAARQTFAYTRDRKPLDQFISALYETRLTDAHLGSRLGECPCQGLRSLPVFLGVADEDIGHRNLSAALITMRAQR